MKNNRKIAWTWSALILIAASPPALTSRAVSQVKDDWRSWSEVPAPVTIDARLLYARYCADCHGSDARGAGPMPTALSEKVPDLTVLAQKNGGVFPRARVERLLTQTTPSRIAHGGLSMAPWGFVLSDRGRDTHAGKLRAQNLTRYLETLQRTAQGNTARR